MFCGMLRVAFDMVGLAFLLLAFVVAAQTWPPAGGEAESGKAGVSLVQVDVWARLLRAVVVFVRDAPAWLVLFVAGLIVVVVVAPKVC